MTEKNPYLAERLQDFGTTIFAEMSALAVRTDSINLGQGFPDTDGPNQVAEAAIRAIRDGHNQYPPGLGIESLRIAVSEHQKRFYGIEVDPETEVLITAGASEALAASLIALVEPGQEVITFEPYFDVYAAAIAMAGGKRRVVTLKTPDYSFDYEELVSKVNSNTRLILLNSPHNPTGKVFDHQELSQIAKLAVERDLLVITDEVYEHLVFDGLSHIPISTLPDMSERTLTISSAAKTFGFTGWKIGWAHGPSELLSAVRIAKQFLTYVNGAPFQHAIAEALKLDENYYMGLALDMAKKRDILCEGLEKAGFEVFRPSGTYYATVDIRPLGDEDGIEFCWDLPNRCGVVAVPNEVFYDNKNIGKPLVRFAYCKKPEVLDHAVEKLLSLKAQK
ncbi:MAG: pyridoxal phosphate-dependent aminotransferase [Acidimicrobiales bacterium]|jgi:N-succinyldiaminopimelate aminotransferase|nr:pyridoxal phosphate-dependent aminotransferase [Acidimicrobiales bacterium]MDP6895280.1 pyridoxal phosphate-dependent aminotransferase [Acidimicrobiales bacterium]HJM37564.1 pyridoxal phosphate-dependent aminotransferase [Acidimicrobiales bacterium]|tara:strand:+ start:647 stop:1822 length:1176 start_codon:yes stop_codon:yes gene_type:complete